MSMRYFVVRLRSALLFFALCVLVLLSLFLGNKATKTAFEALPPQLPLIILDAGHGGEDGGAVAPDGTNEKNLNLSLTLKLDALLRSLGFQTLLTRSDDTLSYPDKSLRMREKKVADLQARLALTKQNPNSILLSIHQNQFSDPRYDGAQIFYSGNHPQSAFLAECLQNAIVRDLQPDNTRQTKQSGAEIFLLNQAQIPAVMAECGFMSNPAELKKLKDESYQQQLAASIANGLLDYFNNRM